eukprot:3459559-Pyramimonas_sp.AAC.1
MSQSSAIGPNSRVFVREVTSADIPEVMRIQASALDVSYSRDWYDTICVHHSFRMHGCDQRLPARATALHRRRARPATGGKTLKPLCCRYDGLLEEEEEECPAGAAVFEVCRRGFVAVLETPIKEKKEKKEKKSQRETTTSNPSANTSDNQ